MDSPALTALPSEGDERTVQIVNRHLESTVAHATKWTLVVDLPRAASRFRLFDTKADADAEFIRLREDGIAHVYVLPPAGILDSRPTIGA